MIDYFKTLAALDPQESVAPRADEVVLLLTGRSVLVDCHLEPIQTSFMSEIAPDGVTALQAHFPYHRRLLTPVPQVPTLFDACYRNALQHLACLALPEFGRLVARHLQVVFERSRDVTFVTGSCGIGLLEAARPHLSIRDDRKWRVIALGPVCWKPPRFSRLTVIRGAGDWISRRFGPVDTHYITGGGHMNYYDDPEVARLVRNLCERDRDT